MVILWHFVIHRQYIHMVQDLKGTRCVVQNLPPTLAPPWRDQHYRFLVSLFRGPPRICKQLHAHTYTCVLHVFSASRFGHSIRLGDSFLSGTETFSFFFKGDRVCCSMDIFIQPLPSGWIARLFTFSFALSQ